MPELMEYLVRGVLIGVTYGLLAYPISLLFVATGTVDLAVGSYAVLAGAVAMALPAPYGLVAAVLIAIFAASLVGIISTILNSRRGGDALASVLASFGFAIILESVVLTAFGKDPMVRQQFGTFWNVMGIRVSPQAAVNAVTGLLILCGVFVLLYRTPWGRIMRATAVNPRGATLAGLPVTSVQFSAYVMSGVLAGIAGILILYTSGLDFASGLPLTLKSLGAAILLGLGNPLRGFFGGVAIGVVEALSVGYAPQSVGTLLPYIFIFVVLCTAGASRAKVHGLRA
ncbi:branched-chain amino acid ABC transporter permease [Variovorax jilinensis]|uniref:branched-chain amino acid ABC transporter permease n=1 Tax=Variovorax jilinensis TaxID=3053513 RepID=UPI0025750055|nr:branched-chain amino acid ABC transporter permease [Variovorax sp. J22P168]